MAATDCSGGLRPHPLGRCPRPRPSSEMGATRTVKGGGAGASPRRGAHRCHRTPGQVKGAFGVAGEGASAPLAPSGEPAAPPGAARRGDANPLRQPARRGPPEDEHAPPR